MPTRSGATHIRAARSERRISLRVWKGLCGGVWRRKRAGVQQNRRSTPGSRPSDSASAESAKTSRLTLLFPSDPAFPDPAFPTLLFRPCFSDPAFPTFQREKPNGNHNRLTLLSLLAAFLDCQDIHLVFDPQKSKEEVFAFYRELDGSLRGKFESVVKGFILHSVGSVRTVQFYDLCHRRGYRSAPCHDREGLFAHQTRVHTSNLCRDIE